MLYNIFYTCISNVGKIRTINQDNFICNKKFLSLNETMVVPLSGRVSTKKPCLFGIFDGMGGEQRGEMAAYIAAENAASLELGSKKGTELSAFCQDVNLKICQYAKENKLSSMGSTAAMLAFYEDSIELCNIGDSKVFRFSDNELSQLSVDHLMAAPPGRKPSLLQNLGIEPSEMTIEPYTAKIDYKTNDIYLICSDGLTDMVSKEDIARILTNNEKNLINALTILLSMALKNGGRDNTSIIICRVENKGFWDFLKY